MATVYNIMLYGGLALAVIFAITAIILFFALKIPKAIGDVTGSTARKKIDEIREKGYESVQGVGISKQEAIRNHTTKISVRDVKSSESSKTAERGRANYEKAVAGINNKKAGEDYLKSIHEDATDILHEDMQELTPGMYADSEEATDVLRESDSEEATDVLREYDSEEATDVLRSDDSESATDVLRTDDSEEATDVLREYDSEEATDVLRSDDSDGATDVLRNEDSDVTNVLADQSGSTGKLTRGEKNMLKMVKNIVVVHTDESI